jgi:C-terminal processing protease CtpA/Prc
VVSKGGEDSSANMSNDDFSIPNFPYRHVSEVVQPGGSKIVNREIKNDDGSLTVLMEFFDSSGQKQKQTTRRRWVSPDGSGSDISLASLSLNGELVILVKKADPKQKVGLKLQRKRSHRGQDMLVVSQVFPSGLFARTPLSVGDQILSINGVDFHEKGDPSDAAVIFANAKEDVRIRAWKSREWIERRQRRLAQTRHLVETFTIPAPKGTSYTFDDSSYGGSIQGYESSKKLTLSNIPTLERRDFGVEMQHTHFGTLLVAKGVSPSGRVAASGLQNGDVILAINGFDLRNDPDVDYAMTLINALDRSIEIEYQRVEDRLEEEAAKVQTQESFSADGTKCIRTETRNPDGSIFVKVEQIGPAIPVDVTLGERGNTTRKSENRDIIGLDGNPSQKAILASVVSDSQPVFVTARKASPSQDIGISLEVSGGRLYVKSISPNGLLVGKPILPGDRIQSINGHDFGTNPSVRKAMAIIAKSSTNVSFEVLKSSQEKGKSPEPTTKRRLQRLCCNKRKTHNSHRDS